jgi:D-glycero-D-manno-heptose 1,7-bisphosphate phosphatase
MSARAAVFLDRDGTMIHETGYLSRMADLHWYSWTADAVRLLNRAGFLVFVTTNQGGIGLRLFTEAFVHEIHEHMSRTLTAADARIDGWFFCPHHPSALIETLRVACECRKPNGGLARQAAATFDVDLSRSFVIGDRPSDIGMGQSIGATSILVRTGHGDDVLRAHGGSVLGASHVAADLMAATSWLLGHSSARGWRS